MLFENLAFFKTKGGGNEEVNYQMTKVKNFWDFYHGKHWKVQKEEGTPQVTLNYCKAFVNKFVAFLFNKGFRFSLTRKEEKEVLPILKKIWDQDNKRDLVCYKMAQIGSICGYYYVLVLPNDETKSVKFTVYNPLNVYPEFDPNDKDSLIKATIFYPRSSSINPEKNVMYSLVMTKDTFAEYEDDTLIKQYPNTLGEMPIFMGKNLEDASSSFGISDLEDVLPLNMEYNEKATDVSDVLDYLGQPVVIVKGANASKIKGTGRIWAGLPVNASVDILNLNAPMDASVGYLKFLKQAMHEISGVPETSLGKELQISNTSSVALHVQYLPLMEKVWMKRINYTIAIQKMTELALKWMEQRNWITKKALDSMEVKYLVDISWNDPLPKDEQQALTNLSAKLKLTLASRESAFRELGEEEGDKITEEIKSDVKEGIAPYLSLGNNEANVGPTGFESGNGINKNDPTSEKSVDDPTNPKIDNRAKI